MSLELQKQYKTVDAYSIVRHLRKLYNEQARIKRFTISNLLFGFEMEEGTPLVQHALKMYEYIERLNQFGYWMNFELSIDLILASLPDSFAQFVLDYRMNNIMSSITNLINLLKIVDGKLIEKKAKEIAPKETCFHCNTPKHTLVVFGLV